MRQLLLLEELEGLELLGAQGAFCRCFGLGRCHELHHKHKFESVTSGLRLLSFVRRSPWHYHKHECGALLL